MKFLHIRCIRRSDVERVMDVRRAIPLVEQAFRRYGMGQATMPSKIYVSMPDGRGDFRAMPACLRNGGVGVKWVSVFPRNARRGLPTVLGTILLNDPGTGVPLAIIDGTSITRIRTGAAGGVAAKHLAPRSRICVALVGCGVQAEAQLDALYAVRRVEHVFVWGPIPRQLRTFVRRQEGRGLRGVRESDLREAVSRADVIVTTTPSTRPLIKSAWVRDGAHINAIGADAPGKQELELALVRRARIVVDDWGQARHSGEINVAVRRGQLAKKNIVCDLGQLIAERRQARRSRNDVTIFDSTGLAIQDIAVATKVYDLCRTKGFGRMIAL